MTTIKKHETRINVFNVQKYNLYDGPGIRTIVFFKGCPMRCKWCANPEGLEFGTNIMHKETLCKPYNACAKTCPLGSVCFKFANEEAPIPYDYADKEHPIDVTRYQKKRPSKADIEGCPEGALTIAGESKTISELMDIIHEDDAFYEMSGGGVTLSGGECLAQGEGALALLKACKQDGLNTAVETAGYVPNKVVMKVAEYTDLFLFDLKHMDSKKHNEWTGVGNERILTNLKWLLDAGYNVKIRMPMLKGINDSEEEIRAIIDFLLPYKDSSNFKGIDLLPYHKLGVNKYKQLGLEYQIKGDPSLSQFDLDRIESYILASDLLVNVVKH
ncbi:TPA: choline TMA-lyase-activating enzyme [Streptococcus suis]|uniref:Choline trimethylamine-lyase activating enzyme n=1 Tax=Streptococcus suis TaxID=1307 RepID=A0A540UZP2_STRSU|nr:choline TMA-lyase-activating enzyme [Streptococcus suis]MCO8178192.1 choline TMA-lyase-activating enzyme [Streptococcus suis]TQE89980.1 choline TMA-lyase-activating enzyme [Streptococcus suis]WNO79369.1 choline TMA-lyase-activating enzyme [Streptococcus suis]WNO83557.1 choline TMA-lyase-activating enzyme [Streptococcus suis]HEL1907817.1 choline TMA-lyase-activating enzyme [Streptococcus suis]